MKKGIHPTDYDYVIFEDTSSDLRMLTRSTTKSTEKGKWDDGKEYPLIKIHISSESHPYYTGKEKLVDVAGRVDRFKAKQDAAAAARKDKKAKASKADDSDKKDSKEALKDLKKELTKSKS